MSLYNGLVGYLPLVKLKGCGFIATEKEILLCFLNGDSQRRIASSLKVSRNTVSRIVAAYMAQKLEASDVSRLTSEALHERLFPTKILAPQQVIPDYEYVHRELLKDGVTVKQLREENVMDCRESGNLYFRYTQFCEKYRDYVDTHRLTMHIRHKPGEKVMVDWTGKTIHSIILSPERCRRHIFLCLRSLSAYTVTQKAFLTGKPSRTSGAPFRQYVYHLLLTIFLRRMA